MGLIISNSIVKRTFPGDSEKKIDSSRVSFIVRRKIRNLAGRRRLGAFWLILHPIVLSLVYLFVFTVIRSSQLSKFVHRD